MTTNYLPHEQHAREAFSERRDAANERLARFGEYVPPRPTVAVPCGACEATGKWGCRPCPTCRGRGHRIVFADRLPAGEAGGAA